jgi:hypothetical protein
MKTAFWQASLTASQAGENGQTNSLENNRIQYSHRPDPHENRRGRMTLQETSSNQQRSPIQPMHLQIRINTTIASTST